MKEICRKGHTCEVLYLFHVNLVLGEDGEQGILSLCAVGAEVFRAERAAHHSVSETT